MTLTSLVTKMGENAITLLILKDLLKDNKIFYLLFKRYLRWKDIVGVWKRVRAQVLPRCCGAYTRPPIFLLHPTIAAQSH